MRTTHPWLEGWLEGVVYSARLLQLRLKDLRRDISRRRGKMSESEIGRLAQYLMPEPEEYRSWHEELRVLDRLISRYGPDAQMADVLGDIWGHPQPQEDVPAPKETAPPAPPAPPAAPRDLERAIKMSRAQDVSLRRLRRELSKDRLLTATSQYVRQLAPEENTRRGRIRAVDRLISRYGPDAKVADVLEDIWVTPQEDRPQTEQDVREEAERQDHVVDEGYKIVDDDGDDPLSKNHGGDGNSGQVDHRAEKAASSPRRGNGQTGGGQQGKTPRLGNLLAQNGGMNGGGRGGGMSAKRCNWFAIRKNGDPVAAAAAARELRRIIEAQCVQRGDASPRIDARALVRELASRRVSLLRCQKRELDIRDFVIAVDESPSCAASVASSYAAAMAVAKILPGRASVVLHTNGGSIRAGERCARWVHRLLQESANAEAFWRSLAERRPGLLLCLGDSDAAWAYNIVYAAGLRVLVLSPVTGGWSFVSPAYPVLAPVYDDRTLAKALKAYNRKEAIM